MKVLICDDQRTTRTGLALLLGLESDIEVVGLAGDGMEALELAGSAAPDLVLMDLKMPRMNGVEATRQLRARFPHIHVLVLTTFDDDAWLFDALQAGAAGYLLKDSPAEELVRAVRGTPAGRSYIDPAVAGKLLRPLSAPPAGPSPSATQLLGTLSERERDVLRQIAQGHTNATIAEKLHLSEGTVRNYVSAILAKLEVEDRTQAAVLALTHRA
ncbi:MAG TPA: response regulator transcription factor [Herpetosiphonaceae bacterium]